MSLGISFKCPPRSRGNCWLLHFWKQKVNQFHLAWDYAKTTTTTKKTPAPLKIHLAPETSTMGQEAFTKWSCLKKSAQSVVVSVISFCSVHRCDMTTFPSHVSQWTCLVCLFIGFKDVPLLTRKASAQITSLLCNGWATNFKQTPRNNKSWEPLVIMG